MKLKEIIEKLNLIVIVEANSDREISDAYASDLLSDVMGNAREGQIWITMQTHKNLGAIASLKDLPAIIIIGNNIPSSDLIDYAKENSIAILSTNLTCYQTCGRLWNLLKNNDIQS